MRTREDISITNRALTSSSVNFGKDQSAVEDMSSEEAIDVIEAGKQIWELYKSGTRLFTKDLLVAAETQLTQTSEDLLLTGIDGRNCVVPRGPVSRHVDLGQEFIYFKTIQKLIRGTGMEYARHPSEAFCSLEVFCWGQKKEKPLLFNTIKTRFENDENIWLGSQTCRSLVDQLSTMPIPVHVTKVVCFGLGGLCWGKMRTTRSSFQHAAALTMAKILARRSGQNIQCYAQDPGYSPDCREYLESRGFKILDGVRGFIEVDDASLVFTVSPDVPVRQVITELARPAVIVWDESVPESNKLGTTEPAEWVVEERDLLSHLNFTDPDSPRTRDMLRDEYDTYPFPEDLDHFGRLEIHARKT